MEGSGWPSQIISFSDQQGEAKDVGACQMQAVQEGRQEQLVQTKPDGGQTLTAENHLSPLPTRQVNCLPGVTPPFCSIHTFA